MESPCRRCGLNEAKYEAPEEMCESGWWRWWLEDYSIEELKKLVYCPDTWAKERDSAILELELRGMCRLVLN